MPDELDGVPITICKPGKRSRDITPRTAPESTIPLVAVIAERDLTDAGKEAPPAKGDRRTAAERLAAAERKAVLAVASSQPHRRGADDPLDPIWESSLGRFCAKRWRGASLLGYRNRMWGAGKDYAKDVREAGAALGVLTQLGEARKGGSNAEISQAQVEAARAYRDQCDRDVSDANAALMAIGQGTRPQRVAERVCCRDEEVGPYDEGLFEAALYRLALHYGSSADGEEDASDASWKGRHRNLGGI